MIKDMLLDMIFPRRCPICDRVLGNINGCGGSRCLVCSEHDDLPFVGRVRCMKCGKEIETDTAEYCSDCERYPKIYKRCYPLFNYIEPVKGSILAVKYRNRREYCDYYGSAMAEMLCDTVRRNGIDVLVPVPVHRHKLKNRGYNQAQILAEAVGRHLAIPVCTDMLLRLEDTRPQKELDNLQRANNMKNAFGAGKSHRNYRRIMIIDDIYTTGATMDTCARILMEMGAEAVYGAVVCIGVA